MTRTLPVLISGLLALVGIFATLIALHGSIDSGVGAGIGALLFIGLACAVLWE